MGRILLSKPKPPAAPAGPAAPPSPRTARLTTQTDNFRKFAFYAGLAMVFARFGVIPELLYFVTGTNTYLLYLIAPFALGGALLTGGLQRTFRSRAAMMMAGCFGWMIIAIPFSSWVGGSFERVVGYGRTEILMLLITGGLAVTWKEVRAVMYTVACAGLITLLSARLFLRLDTSGRISLDSSGTIGNSNDLAAHLLLVLPFLLFVMFDPKRGMITRILLLGAVGYGFWVIVGTASRGALLALGVGIVFYLFRASMRQTLSAVVLGPVLAATVFVVAPQGALNRLASLFGGEQHVEAEQSAYSRSYLFEQSVWFTLRNPILGVGPGQFSNFEGRWSKDHGFRGRWHDTHCVWTQVSSECGIPALILFAGALWLAWRLVSRTYRRAREQGNAEIANVCFCFLLAMLTFLTAASFLSLAYRFYVPALVGLAISIQFAAQSHLAAQAPEKTPRPGWLQRRGLPGRVRTA